MYIRWTSLLLLAAGICAHRTVRDHATNDYFALHLDGTLPPSYVAERLGASWEGPLGHLPDHHTFSCPKGASFEVADSLEELRRRKRRRRRSPPDDVQVDRPHLKKRVEGLEGVLWSEKQALRKRLVKRIPPPPLASRQQSNDPDATKGKGDSEEQQAAIKRLDEIVAELDIQDPIFKDQWHLFNTDQVGHDLNVTGVWLEGVTGQGVISAVIDDGLDMYSEDLKANYYAAGSWDFNEDEPEPKPRLFDDKHGTRCAGEIAAGKNNVCGVGMAYDSKVAGIRILSKPITDEDEAVAVNYHYQENQIYSCSWGPPDDGKTMEAPGVLIQRAMVNGIQQGRGGLGSVFVFAAGNGAASDDNCNFDGYTNSIYSVTVGGIDHDGNHPYYSEACSAQLVVTYSSGQGVGISTTDVGIDKCYSQHGGTSAAGPLVVGTVALALSVRPELSWRDVQYLCIEAAVPIHLDDSDWQDTATGHKFSHTYGYGKIDAHRYVEAARTWNLVKPQAWWHSPWIGVQHPIPQGDKGLAASFDVTQQMLTTANFERLEHVTVTMNIEHTRRGDLSVELRSPTGLVSHLSTARRMDEVEAGYDDWTFMSVVHWGEAAAGTWTVVVKDASVNEHNGTFVDWRLNLWGECIDAAKQGIHPLPDEHDDDHETASAVISTASVNHPATPTAAPGNPTDHIDRPTKPKPTGSASETPSSTEASTTSSASAAPESTHTYSDGFLPSFFPTFGVSKKTQIWIYGSVGLIVSFCLGLGVYFLVQRRKRLRNVRDGYEFEMVGTDDDDDARRGLNGYIGGRRGQNRARRGGELYDAFAAGSDDELFSDDSDAYHDKDTPEESGTSKTDGSDEHQGVR